MRMRVTAFQFALAAGALALIAGTLWFAPVRAATSLAWHACPEDAGTECASLTVPVDWSHPDGGTIDIAVARKSTRSEDRIGTLIELPGGPGTSGVDALLHGDRFSPDLHAHFDIVSFDPRGVKRSHPLRCDAGLSAWPNLLPDAGGSIDEVHSYARRLADSCRRDTGALLDHLDSASVARDVEALRHALGARKITLYGRSYGTMAGQAYAELFPDHLRAMLIDSVDDHSLDGSAFLATEARAGRDAFGEFVSWCDRDTACALHGTDIRARYTALFDRAERGALRDPQHPDRPLAALVLSRNVTARLYQPEWPALADDLRTLGDQPQQPNLPFPQPEPTGTPAVMSELIACSDWSFDIPDQARWRQLWADQNADAGTLRAHFAWAAGSLCSGWPIAPANPPHVPAAAGAPPILVMNGMHDPATPYEWATAVTAHLPGAVLLTYDGWGHGVYGRNSCTTTTGDRYLISLTMPPSGIHCAA